MEIAVNNNNNPLVHFIGASRATNTKMAYARAWKRFVAAVGNELPADPYVVASYLAQLGTTHSPATVRMANAAISYFHRIKGHETPTGHAGVKAVISGINRMKGPSVQVEGLDRRAFELIELTSDLDSINELREVCLISVMRDGLLRRSEATALVWDDLAWEDDGSGRLAVGKSKNDQIGHGSILYISPATMNYVARWRPNVHVRRIFPISDSTVVRCIKKACERAGLSGDYSGHSPRIGMAMDLARTTSLPALMQAGRWKSHVMPVHYIKNITAGQGAVADWYRRKEGGDG